MMKHDVSALFVEPTGIYSRMPGVDAWPESRDARLYNGPYPVVAHPPCARWGRYATKDGRTLGEDNGCGASAVASVRRWGGLLEHPADSWLFAAQYLPRPGLPDLWGGRTVALDQVMYGHLAIKPTWVYICGECELAAGRGPRQAPRPLENLSRAQRLATPPELAHALVLAAVQVGMSRRASVAV